VAFIAAGTLKAFRAEKAIQNGMKWVGEVPPGLVTFIGASELLGGIGLILPAVSGILPWLTPLAGVSLALVMLLAAGFHLSRKEYNGIPVNLVLFLLTAFVAYGRFVVAPL
jgi:DoxX-like family